MFVVKYSIIIDFVIRPCSDLESPPIVRDPIPNWTTPSTGVNAPKDAFERRHLHHIQLCDNILLVECVYMHMCLVTRAARKIVKKTRSRFTHTRDLISTHSDSEAFYISS